MLAFSLNSMTAVMACILHRDRSACRRFSIGVLGDSLHMWGCARATAIAIVLFSASLLGGGFGPLASGALSDALSADYGREGLRYALMAMTMLLPASALMFYVCGRAMPSDVEP